MPKTRPGFTFHEHQEVGRELREIDVKLGSLLVRVSAAYGPTSVESKAAKKSADYVGSLRSKLEEAVSRENPETSRNDEVLACYYGKDKHVGSSKPD